MPTQNTYTPEVVQLEGGLDFVTPRPMVAPGSLIDCYNYEVADHLGYGRVPGIELFDGRPSVSTIYTNLYKANYTGSPDNLATDVLLFVTPANGIEVFFAIVTSVTAGVVTFYVFNMDAFYSMYNVGVNTMRDQSGTTYTISNLASANVFDNSADLSTYIAALSSEYNNMTVTSCSTIAQEASNVYRMPAIGAHWFADQLYTVNNLNSLVFDSGKSQVLPNDLLTGGSETILVRDVQLVSGSWATSDAKGKILYSVYPVGTYNVQSHYQTFADNTALTVSRGSTTLATAIKVRNTISGTIPPNWYATLMRSVGPDALPAASLTSGNFGWQELELGYAMPFNTGTTHGPPVAVGRDSNPPTSLITDISSLIDPTGTGTGITQFTGTLQDNTAPAFGNWSYNHGAAGHPEQCIVIPNDNLWIRNTVTNTAGNVSIPLILSKFDFSAIPSDVIITGLELHGNAFITNSGVGVSQHVLQAAIGLPTTTSPQIKQTPVITSTSSAASQSFSIGGSGDLWGLDGLTVADLSTLLIAIVDKCTVSGTIAVDQHLDFLSLQVHYQTSSSIYYFWNGVDDVQATVTKAYINPITGGSWAGGDATGVLQVVNVTPYSTSARRQITSGDIMYTAPSHGGNAILTVTADMKFAGLPSLNQVVNTSKSRYEIIDANFYGNETWDSIYGVSGAGRAFVYDGFYFRYIYTGLNDTLDLPRHLAFHNFHLILGYTTGSALSSVTGDPEDFDGENGAGEFDTGDAITGLIRQSGTSLAILCRKSIHSLNGTDNTNFSVSVITPYEGCIEYTAIDCGKLVYASYRGISTLEQTAAYGNFMGTRLSANMTPWLLPRLTNLPLSVTVGPVLTAAIATGGVMFAMAVRNKNQYRLYFKDGYILTMTLMGAESTPVFTIQQINFNEGGGVLIPLAASSGVDSTGKDRNHVSWYDPNKGYQTDDSLRGFMYELDRGWGFLSTPIKAWFTTTHNFFNSPFDVDTIRKLRIHGQSQGIATATIAVSSDYLSNDFTNGLTYGQTVSNAIPQDISLPINGGANSSLTLTDNLQPKTSIANVSKRGRSFSIQVATDPDTLEPPHVAQVLLAQIKEGKAEA